MKESEVKKHIATLLKNKEDPFWGFSARKGIRTTFGSGSFLSSGFIYAPYVPIQVTPTYLTTSFQPVSYSSIAVSGTINLEDIKFKFVPTTASYNSSEKFLKYSKTLISSSYFTEVTIETK